MLELLRKANVDAALDSPTGEVKEVLVLRGDFAKSSVKKYQAMQNVAGSDGQARGLNQSFGAGRSGRPAGRLVQVQNLPRNYLPDLDQARTLVCGGNLDAVELLYESVPDTLSQLIRTSFTPSPGHWFIVADFSAIEARGIAWPTAATTTLQALRQGKDLYCEIASRMFGVPVEKHGANSELRRKQKIAVLACGYSGSVGALKAMGALGMGLAEHELKPIVVEWRATNPHIVDSWADVEQAAIAAMTAAKITNLSAAKITTGFLAAGRIQTGSITSDKLTIANAAIMDAKNGALSAGKITSGYLAAGQIAAGSITSDKLTIVDGFIQTAMIKGCGDCPDEGLLAEWNQSIRISLTQIVWYDGSTLEGTITRSGTKFWYSTRYIGEMARGAQKENPDAQGIVNQLAYRGNYVAWTYQNASCGDYFTCLTLDPKGRFYGEAGIHLGDDLRTNGFKFYTTGSRYVRLQDTTRSGKGTFAGRASANGNAKVVFHTYDLMVVANGAYYNMSRLFDRTRDLMSRVNSLIQLLNDGGIASISGSRSNITWQTTRTPAGPL